ncbi:MAG: biotin--[acetyl-CoA-carboxylase] ligase [Candidatus Aminicenantes bacterium]|nr:biotin--[acetyl-CoA-carboxylase] ligase [Candidatus Aminicenantes bacterium]
MEIGKKIHRIKSCPSTNDLAKELAKKGAQQGEVVVCDEQTRGKGTKGRIWHSVSGKGLCFSVLLFPSRSDLSLLPLAASVAVKDAVFQSLGILIELKWPNDLVYKGRKIGGILCESCFSGKKLNHSIVGIGINVKQSEDDFPADLQKNAGSLEMIIQKDIDKDQLLQSVCCELGKWYQRFLKNKDDHILKQYLEACPYHINDLLNANARGKPVTGLFKGLDKEGKMILEVKGKEKRFLSGELNIRDIKRGDK